jgi:hypothetical protein
MRNMIQTTFLFINLVLVAFSSYAQTEPQRVTRSTNNKIPMNEASIFSITGEKATIILSTWSKNYGQMKIVSTAIHPDKKIATKEIEYMHYVLAREGNIVELRNAFMLPPKTDRMESKVEVLIEVIVPVNTELRIRNKYGDTEINGTAGKLSIDLEFSDLSLKNIMGTVDIRSVYSEVRSENLMVNSFSSHDEETKYILQIGKGSYTFNSRHSVLDLTPGDIQQLVVNASHTDVTIRPKEFKAYNYDLVSKDGKIFVPSQFNSSPKKGNIQSTLALKHKDTNQLITVKTTFNNITIQ